MNLIFAIYFREFIHLSGQAWPFYIMDPLFIRPYRVSINYSPSIKSNDCQRRGVGLILHADHYLKSSQRAPVKLLSQDYSFISSLNHSTLKFSYFLALLTIIDYLHVDGVDYKLSMIKL